MPIFQTQKRVAVQAETAFEVASDVARYSEFLPLLERAIILGEVSEANGIKQFRAELSAGYTKLGLRESFVSRVICDAEKRVVTATSQDPPFKDMKAEWVIRPGVHYCDVSISIEYKMRSMMMQMVLSGVMELAVNKVMAAFEARALSLHKSVHVA
jgi:coenzyme Q-binding protein COQ10